MNFETDTDGFEYDICLAIIEMIFFLLTLFSEHFYFKERHSELNAKTYLEFKMRFFTLTNRLLMKLWPVLGLCDQNLGYFN